MIDISEAVECFRNTIQYGWPMVNDLGSRESIRAFSFDNDYENDWLQANWEMLVENSIAPELGVALEIYGQGADLNGTSSRVWNPLVLPTHQIHCVLGNGQSVRDFLTGDEVKGDLILDAFCTVKGEYFAYEAPFDHVELQGDEPRIISCQGLKYIAVPHEDHDRKA